MHKDRLIRFLFQKKKDLLSLYNAINHSHYENEDDLEIYTMEDYIYMGMKNDLSFMISTTLNLYEHQSTNNPNMPIRLLIYISELIKEYIEKNIFKGIAYIYFKIVYNIKEKPLKEENNKATHVAFIYVLIIKLCRSFFHICLRFKIVNFAQINIGGVFL